MDYLVWNADPVLLRIGPLSMHWYGLLFATGFALAFYILRAIYRREQRPQPDLERLFWYCILGALIGARLVHVLFYDPAFYLANPVKILKIWEGGLASHGGGAGLLLGLWLFSRRHGESFLWLADRLAIPVSLGGGLIRIGNFFNSEIYGIPTRVDWAVVFSRVDPLPRHPVQLYEAASYLLICLLLSAIYLRLGRRCRPGYLLGLLLSLVFTTRLLLEPLKTQQSALAGDLPLSMGQLLSLPYLALGVGLMVWTWRRGRRATDA